MVVELQAADREEVYVLAVIARARLDAEPSLVIVVAVFIFVEEGDAGVERQQRGVRLSTSFTKMAPAAFAPAT